MHPPSSQQSTLPAHPCNALRYLGAAFEVPGRFVASHYTARHMRSALYVCSFLRSCKCTGTHVLSSIGQGSGQAVQLICSCHEQVSLSCSGCCENNIYMAQVILSNASHSQQCHNHDKRRCSSLNRCLCYAQDHGMHAHRSFNCCA